MSAGHTESRAHASTELQTKRLYRDVAGNQPRMADGDIHVRKSGDDWTVTVEAVQGDLVSFDTAEEAVRTARRIAESACCEAIVHDDVVPLDDEAPI